MFTVVNHTTYDVAVEGKTLRLFSSGESAILRLPTSRLASLKRGWRHLLFFTSHGRLDGEKVPLMGRPKVKVYYRHVRLYILPRRHSSIHRSPDFHC